MSREHNYYVYIVTSESGTLYIGMTNNLERKVYEHKNNLIKGFTSKYGCKELIYYDHSNDVNATIAREKQLKKWRRSKRSFNKKSEFLLG